MTGAPREGLSVFTEGVEAARRRDDPLSCPYEKMTRERYEWERGQHWGVQLIAALQEVKT